MTKLTDFVRITEYAIAHGVQKKMVIPFLNSAGSKGTNVVKKEPRSEVMTMIEVIP